MKQLNVFGKLKMLLHLHKHKLPEDIAFEIFFKESLIRDSSGLYIFKLLFLNKLQEFPNSQDFANNRF